jgi:hypothetical protein
VQGFWKNLLLKWRLLLVAFGLLIFILFIPTLASWSDRIVLPALSNMNIFSITSQLVTLTDDMISETDKLKGQVEKAGQSLSALDDQKRLLDAQIATSGSIQTELGKQLDGNISAREKMEQILSRQADTYQITSNVASTASAISGQMNSTISHLQDVANTTGQIGENSNQVNGLLDQLLAELSQSEKNFRFLGHITSLLDSLQRLIGIHLPFPRGTQQEPPTGGEPSPVKKIVNGVTGLPKQIISGTERSKQGQTEEKDKKGLLDFLLP